MVCGSESVNEIDEIMDRNKQVRKRTADLDLSSFDLGISDLEATPPPAPKPTRRKRGKKINLLLILIWINICELKC